MTLGFYEGNHLVFVFTAVNFILTAGDSIQKSPEKNDLQTETFIYLVSPTGEQESAPMEKTVAEKNKFVYFQTAREN